MKGIPIVYSATELAWIKRHATLARAPAHAEFCRRFGRSDVKIGTFNELCKRRGWLTGRCGRFEKGIVPHNTGRTMPFNANSAAHRFKKGNLPHNTKFEGHERLSKDGYVEISVAQVNPHTGFARRYVQKHTYLWEKANGPVPKGMCLKSLDGDKSNSDPGNWQLMPRAMLPRLNGIHGRGYDAAPPELKPTLLAIARLEQKAFEKGKS
jgi:hypothetical protein